jgi:hypothetical protein
VFERLILEANWRCERIPFNKGTLLVKRGEKVTSVRQIAEWVSWHERGVLRTPNPKTIRDILTWLTREKMITIYRSVGGSNSQVTHYNIVNYCEYQAVEVIEVTPKVTVDGQVSKQSLDTNNNINKEKKVNREKKPTASVAGDDGHGGNPARIPPAPYDQFIDLYNRCCPTMPQAEELTDERQKKIRTRWKEHPDLAWWEKVFTTAEAIPYFHGENDRGWKCTVDYFIQNGTKAVQLLERNPNIKPIKAVDFSKLKSRFSDGVPG